MRHLISKFSFLAFLVAALLIVPFFPFPIHTTNVYVTFETQLYDYYVGATSPGYGYIQQVSFRPIQTGTLAGLLVSLAEHPIQGWDVKRTYQLVLNQSPQTAVFYLSVRLESGPYVRTFNSTTTSISDLYQHIANCTVELPGLPSGTYAVGIGLYLQGFGLTDSQNLTLSV